MDSKIVQVALSGLENILRVGKQERHQMDGVVVKYFESYF